MVAFNQGAELEYPARTNVNVLGDDEVELQHDGVDLWSGAPIMATQHATLLQMLEIAVLHLRAVQAALTPGP